MAFKEARFAPPEPASFAPQAGGNAANLRDLFEVCVAEGLLVLITDDIYLHADVESEMRRKVEEKLAAGGPGLTVAETAPFRDKERPSDYGRSLSPRPERTSRRFISRRQRSSSL